MKHRPYQDDSDVELLQAFNAAAIAETDHCGYLHPGDIPHHIFSGNKLYDPSEILRIWEDEQGVAAWVLVGPRHRSYDAQVRPDLRGGDFEREVLKFADERTLELMRHHKIEGDRLLGDAFRCDTARSKLLTELGWTPDDAPPYVLNRAPLADVPAPILPDCYTIRAARGLEEAAALAEIHTASFGATWSPELYRRYMTAPGYAADREFVAVAPDGTFAAFTVTWHDSLNRTGLLEPVGTHPDHRRRGLGKAVVLHAMHKMKAAGMAYATVANAGTNEASRELYKACGFEPWHMTDDYSKPIPPQRED
ncbi:GNAT family N-acetyltransferase [Candidatus Bipolaricaulota bacterium]